ncbi:MAG: hypothetical protein PHR13_01030 [Dysgonamonadaceae bacterium]|nr:hypothetical protein [Dysgonamonadaceae bacterium]
MLPNIAANERISASKPIIGKFLSTSSLLPTLTPSAKSNSISVMFTAIPMFFGIDVFRRRRPSNRPDTKIITITNILFEYYRFV